jgi:hypothetical protein
MKIGRNIIPAGALYVFGISGENFENEEGNRTGD